MIRPPPRSTRIDPPLPVTTLFRSPECVRPLGRDDLWPRALACYHIDKIAASDGAEKEIAVPGRSSRQVGGVDDGQAGARGRIAAFGEPLGFQLGRLERVEAIG